jgi:hypothetical protein
MSRRRQGLFRGVVLVLVAVGAAGACGCHLPHFFVWLFADRHPTVKVEAEYELEAERLVIIPYAGTDILFTYSEVPVEIAADLINQIRGHIPGRVKTIIHPVEVNRWQESNLDWPNYSLKDIARTFAADTVLYVELERYSLFDERSANLYHGRVRARLQVAKAEAARNPVWEDTIEVTFPPDRPIGVLDTTERRMRQGTNLQFAIEVIRKFYDHEVEAKGGGA